MPGKQAKILAAVQIDNLLIFAETTRYPLRDRVIVLLSVKAGLRAAEIANLTWDSGINWSAHRKASGVRIAGAIRTVPYPGWNACSKRLIGRLNRRSGDFQLSPVK